jgi:transposase
LIQQAIHLKRSIGVSVKNICKRLKRSQYWVRQALGHKRKTRVADLGGKVKRGRFKKITERVAGIIVQIISDC